MLEWADSLFIENTCVCIVLEICNLVNCALSDNCYFSDTAKIGRGSERLRTVLFSALNVLRKLCIKIHKIRFRRSIFFCPSKMRQKIIFFSYLSQEKCFILIITRFHSLFVILKNVIDLLSASRCFHYLEVIILRFLEVYFQWRIYDLKVITIALVSKKSFHYLLLFLFIIIDIGFSCPIFSFFIA